MPCDWYQLLVPSQTPRVLDSLRQSSATVPFQPSWVTIILAAIWPFWLGVGPVTQM